MRLPILYTLSWPDRVYCSEVTWPRLDLCKYGYFPPNFVSIVHTEENRQIHLGIEFLQFENLLFDRAMFEM